MFGSFYLKCEILRIIEYGKLLKKTGICPIYRVVFFEKKDFLSSLFK